MLNFVSYFHLLFLFSDFVFIYLFISCWFGLIFNLAACALFIFMCVNAKDGIFKYINFYAFMMLLCFYCHVRWPYDQKN